jgi:putative hydrolase of the HAD superfamily
LHAILALPGPEIRVHQRLAGRHAERVLARLGLADLFEACFTSRWPTWLPKPHPQTFEPHRRRASPSLPETSAFFEDTEKNLAPAAELGMTTVLVGPHAAASTADFVHHRTHDLTPFLPRPP